MARKILIPLSLTVLFLFTGCPYGYRYNEGKFPPEPVNLSVLNSIYDDYNMTSPVIEQDLYLYFSSNRNSSGIEFDIVGGNFHLIWDRDEGTLTVDDKPAVWKNYHYVDSLLYRMNTPANELGPYSLPFYSYSGLTSYYTDMIAYSCDQSGNLDLKLVYFEGVGENPAPGDGSFSGPLSISSLNSEYNEAYLSFYGSQFVKYPYGATPGEITELCFCSDRHGNFDIYTAAVPFNSDIIQFLTADTTLTVSPLEILNSEGNDKCPYIDGQLLVFASDRPGGYGGFDLYYSRREIGGWSEPVNFGDRINSESNEYRPIVSLYYEFDNDLLLFSSDRPGGKGGYDLYYVGIPKMIEVY